MAEVQIGLALALLIVCGAIGIWDLYASFFLPRGHTVSVLLQQWAMEFPALPIAIGFLLGHLFWPIRR